MIPVELFLAVAGVLIAGLGFVVWQRGQLRDELDLLRAALDRAEMRAGKVVVAGREYPRPAGWPPSPFGSP